MNQVANFLKKLGLLPLETADGTVSATAAEMESPAVKYAQKPQRENAPAAEKAAPRQRSHLVAYQTLWLQELIRSVLKRRDPKLAERLEENPLNQPSGEVDEQTSKMVSRLSSLLNSFAVEFNSLTFDIPGFEGMQLTVGDMRAVQESVTAKPYGMVNKGASEARKAKVVTYLRFRLSTPSWCLSIRANKGRIEFYLIPATDVFVLLQSETPARLRSALMLNNRMGMQIWTSDGLPISPDELHYICRVLFKSLLFASAQNVKEEVDTASVLQTLEGDALKTTVRELLMAEQNMAQKIVSQQEEIQNRIARDLHDAVIADMMALKRSLSEGGPIESDSIGSSIEQICQKIREICHDLTPRDLRDWGLQTVIEDLLERASQRTGTDCSLECERDLPEFPYPVQLHLFRIIQESLNNIEKYAQASKVSVRFDVSDQLVRLTMRDDGKGFASGDLESRRAVEGGTGMSGIKERAEMIRCFYPTRLKFDSSPGEGCVTILEMRLSDGAWPSVRD